jgi:hypothetical protein
MTDALVSSARTLDDKTLLARINQRIALLRVWLSHDHNDEPFWWARRTTAPRSQQERHHLRPIANLLHVERAASHGRLHGKQFETLEAQRAWLDEHSEMLARLREGKLPV